MTHASATFTTTDEVCAALLAFVESIRRSSHAEAVEIPALRVDGQLMQVRMTLNADSAFVVVPIVAEPQDEQALAAESATAVDELRTRRER